MTISAWLHGIDGLLIDWDGTVVDSIDTNFTNFTDVLAGNNVNLDRAWHHAHAGLALRDLLERLRLRHTCLPPTDALVVAGRARRTAGWPPPTPIAGTVALIDEARRLRIPCAIATGAARVVVLAEVGALSLVEHFAAVVTPDDVTRGKPAPDLFLAAAERIGVPPQRCAAIDDSAEGIAAAHAAGITLVLTLRAGTIVIADRP